MSSPVIRILSDIHYADCGSWVHDLRSIAPLLEGADRLIVNGDSMDTQVTVRADERLAEYKAFLTAHAPEFTLVTGNHDPDISDVHEVLLADKSVWVTHGDVFFDDVAPWSRKAPEIRRRVTQHIAGMPEGEFRRIESRYRVLRQACLKLPFEHDPNLRGRWVRLQRYVRLASNVRGVANMLRAWRDLPDIALSYALEQRPQAQVIVTGHTHRHGVWHRSNGRIVINTGSFCPPKGGQLIELHDRRVVVREIDRRNGEFRLGPTATEIRLAAPGVSAIEAQR